MVSLPSLRIIAHRISGFPMAYAGRGISTQASSMLPVIIDGTADVSDYERIMIDRIASGIAMDINSGQFVKKDESHQDQAKPTVRVQQQPMYDYDPAPRGIDIESFRRALAQRVTKEKLHMPQSAQLGPEHQPHVEKAMAEVIPPAKEVARILEKEGAEALLQAEEVRSKLADMLRVGK